MFDSPRLIVAGVLGAVGQHRAVRADRGGDERAPIGALASQLNAPSEQRGRGVTVDTAVRESLVARLVAGADHDVGAGVDVCTVDLDDRGGILDREASRPQLVAEIGAPSLELGREPPIEHDDPRVLDRTDRSTIVRRVPAVTA